MQCSLPIEETHYLYIKFWLCDWWSVA